MTNVILLIVSVLVLLLCTYPAWAGGEYVGIKTVAFEAANQPIEGQVLVARVIQLRAEERKQTVREVCYSPLQFSCYNNTKEPRLLSDKELRVAKQAWTLAKHSHDMVNLYCRTDVADKTYWTKHPKVTFIKTVGDHSFYWERR